MLNEHSKNINCSSFDLIITPTKAELNYWRDIWRFRELFLFLAWREILIRYKQTIIGIAWSVLRPLLTMLILSIIFGKFAKLPSQGVPYVLLVFTGLLPWFFFASSLADSSASLIENSSMISKIYFPRMVMPISMVLVNLSDFLISLVMLCGLFFYYRYSVGSHLILIGAFLLEALVLAVGCGLWLSALNVKYRDFRYVVPFIIQFGIYISPVAYDSTIVPETWRDVFYLNPMAGIIDGFRLSLLGQGYQIYPNGMLISFSVSILLLVSGIWYFRSVERYFNDVI